MITLKRFAALLSILLIPALLGGCFTVDIKIPEGEAPLPTAADAPQTTAGTATLPAEASAAPAGDVTAMTTADQLRYFNAAVNRIKAERAGFTKSKLTATKDITLSNSLANSLVGLVKGALLSEDAVQTVVQPGENSDAVMSPYNVPFVSGLTEADVDRIEVAPAGGGYTITVHVKGETNPAAEGSVCSRIFEFITVDDVVSTYAPKVGAEVAREDIEVVFSDCWAKATVDAAGTVTAYETFVQGTMNLKNAKIRIITTDVSVVLASTTTYTDFRFS